MQPQDITIPAPIVRAIAFDEGRSTSGLRLLVVPDSSLPWITLRLTFRHGGARSDGPLPGRADFTAGMLSAGTEQRDAITFARSIEQLGADLGADAGSDTMALELATLSEHLDEAFDLFTTMLRHPTFTDEEVDRERAQRRASLLASAAEPDYLAERLLTQEVMRGTPYATPIEGDDASLAAMSRAAIVAHHASLSPDDAFIIATGDITLEELTALVDRRFGDWKPTTIDEATGRFPVSESINTSRIHFIERPGSVQTAIRIGYQGVARSHPDYVPLRIVTTILGDSFNSRLNNRLREELGFTYGAWASLGGMLDGGMMMIGTSVPTAQQNDALDAIDEEIARLCEEPVPQEDLTMVHRYLAGRHAMAHESAEGVGRLVESLALYNLPPDHHRTTLARIAAITPEEIRSITTRYLHPDTKTTVTCGDRNTP